MKKMLSLLLAALMLVSALASCGGDPVATTEAPVTTAAPVETTAPTNVPDLPAPETLNIAGEFNILVSGNYVRNDFHSDGEEGSTAVEIAIFRRNELMKEKYGVEIVDEDVTKFGSTNGSGTGFTKIYTDYMSGESNYDAASIGTYDVCTLAYSGYIHDLNDIPYLNLEKDYWDQRANEDLSINGKMFYTNGDIGVVNHMTTHAILFNKDMISEYDLENPYDLVRDDEWYLEKFGQLVKSVGEDLNQDGIYNENDRYGLLTWNDPMVAFLSTAGEKICTVNEQGLIELSLYNERVVNLYDAVQSIVFDAAHSYNYQYDNVTGRATPSSVWNTNRDAIFTENRAVFYLNTLATVERHRDSDVDFGVLPYPKFDDTQDNYGHQVSAYHSQFICIPELAPDYERSGIVLEELAYQGQEIIRPAYYEQTLVGRSVRDEDSVEMLDIIFASRVYDLGAYYNIGTYKDQLGRMFVNRTPISSMYETYKSQAEVKIKTINDIMQDLVND